MGAASKGTELSAQAAQGFQNNLGRMLSVGQEPGVRQQVMQQHQDQGAKAAHTIRMRYFQEEFKQVQSMRVQPELDRKKDAFGLLQQTLDTQTRPVPRIKSNQELDAEMEAGGHTQDQYSTVQVGTDGEGKPKVEPVLNRQPGQHGGYQGDSTGMVESTEVLSFTGADGRPIAVASPEGVSHRQAALTAFGQVNTSVMQNIMGIMGEYAGNPFASQYGMKLIEHLEKESSLAATGQADPQKGQEFLDQHEQRENAAAESDAKQQEMEQANIAEQGVQNSLLQQARTNVEDLDLNASLKSKLLNDEELTPLQKATVAATQDRQNELLSKNASTAARRTTGISQANLHNSQNYMNDLSTRDPVFQQDYGSNMADLQNGYMEKLRHRTQDELAEQFRQAGIADHVSAANAFRNHGTFLNDDVEAYLEQMTSGQDFRDAANGMAMLNRLPSLEQEQPEVARQIDNTLDYVEENMRSYNDSLGEEAIPLEQLEQRVRDMRADRHRVFFRTEYNYDPSKTMSDAHKSFKTRGRTKYNAYGVSKSAKSRGLGTQGANPTDPTGPLASSPDLPGIDRRPEPVAEIPKGIGSRAVDDYVESLPGTQALNVIGELGGKELWRGGKKVLNYNVLNASEDISNQVAYEWNMVKGAGGALARFATTGSFSKPRTLKDLIVSSTSKAPSVSPADVPQLDSFSLAEEIRASKAERDRSSDDIAAEILASKLARDGSPKPRTHYRDRERGR